MGGALSFTRKSEDLLCRHRVFRLPCVYMSQQWGVPFVSSGSPRIFSHLCQSCTAALFCRGLAVGGVLAGGVPCGLFPPVWCFPPRCLGAAPLRFFCRALLHSVLCLMCSLLSGVPAPGRPPGLRHLYIRILIYMHSHTHIFLYGKVYFYMYKCVYIYIYIYIIISIYLFFEKKYAYMYIYNIYI